MESDLGGLFENFQESTSTRTSLEEVGHPQPPTPVATENTAANSTFNGTGGKEVQSHKHDILLGQRQNMTKSLPHILGRGKEKLSGSCHKKQPNLEP